MTETSEELRQLRPNLWDTVNDRYPGVMIRNETWVPLEKPSKPLDSSRICLVSTAGVQLKESLPFDTVHPVGDYTYRRVPSNSATTELEIHQLKYPTFGANEDINVIFPIERLQELQRNGLIGGLTTDFFSFIGYNMDAERLEQTLAMDIAAAVVAQQPDIVLMAPA